MDLWDGQDFFNRRRRLFEAREQELRQLCCKPDGALLFADHMAWAWDRYAAYAWRFTCCWRPAGFTKRSACHIAAGLGVLLVDILMRLVTDLGTWWVGMPDLVIWGKEGVATRLPDVGLPNPLKKRKGGGGGGGGGGGRASGSRSAALSEVVEVQDEDDEEGGPGAGTSGAPFEALSFEDLEQEGEEAGLPPPVGSGDDDGRECIPTGPIVVKLVEVSL